MRLLYLFSFSCDDSDNTPSHPQFESLGQPSLSQFFSLLPCVQLLFEHYYMFRLWRHLVVDSPHLSLQDQASKDKALQNMAALSSAQIVSPSMIKNHLPPLPPASYQQHRVRPPSRNCYEILTFNLKQLLTVVYYSLSSSGLVPSQDSRDPLRSK